MKTSASSNGIVPAARGDAQLSAGATDNQVTGSLTLIHTASPKLSVSAVLSAAGRDGA